jgi:type IV pilus assembly protein PilP
VTRASVGLLVALGFAAAVAAGQAPAKPPVQPAAPAAPSTTPSAAPAVAPATPDAYSYNPEGRRDPFVSLLTRGVEVGTTRETPLEGREGLAIGEVSIRGIVRSRNAFLAMVQGPDNKSYIIHTGDKMLDGVVKAITSDAVVFAQDVNDPLSLVKQREVRKMLRVPEEGK